MPDLHPLLAEWFRQRFSAATEAQLRAWPEVRAGRDVLVSAPTGSGKTLAAFLICLDRLVRVALGGALQDRTAVVYVSPLKALSNDIQKNLEAPLAEITALAAEWGMLLPPIRTAVRTGDTSVWERQQMLRHPPHILVTTPESLFILLTAEKSRRVLATIDSVIVDEIHAVVDDKRGAHLALSLARLDDLVAKAGRPRPQRIGLSATVNPIEDVARFLVGSAGDRRSEHRALSTNHGPPSTESRAPGPEADVAVIDSGHRRQLDLAVEVPKDELGAVATKEMWSDIYDRLAELIVAHRTTLVFVNTRRLCERVAHHLGERLGEEVVLAHHGSLSRRLRQRAEARLKAGQLRAVVATASLELGIDIGSVELTCQVGSPRAITVALQRIGRSGHQVAGVIPKGRLFATTRDELLECAALVRAIRAGALDRLEIPPWPLDVLAQQIVAAAACEGWREDDLFALARRADPYRDLPRREFDALIEMLSDGITTQRGRSGTYLHRDQVNGVVRGRRGARLAAITSGGAIPDNANYLVVAEPEGTTVGTVDEDFAVESIAGDVFLLGTTSWRIRRVESGRVRVEDAHGAAPSIPFWRGQAQGRTSELSQEVSRVRTRLVQLIGCQSTGGSTGLGTNNGAEAEAFLIQECGLDRAGAEQAVTYVRAGLVGLGALPTDDTVIAERFFDEAGGMQLVLHAPFGARVNRAWGLALCKRFCRSFNFELQAAATDNGIVISLSEQHSFPLEVVFKFLNIDTVEDVLTQALLDAPMFTARWRWNVSRALAVLRFAGGRKVPPPIQRMRSDDLLASVFPDQAACAENLVGEIRIPDHPLVNETIRDCLHEAMDINGLRAVLGAIDGGQIRTLAIKTAEPSPFSHEILNANPYAFLDDAPLEERRARAVQMRRTLGPDAGEMGVLDRAAIDEVAEDSWPVVRDADELHDALLTLVMLPPVPKWHFFFDELSRVTRAGVMRVGASQFWVAAERVALARLIHPDAALAPDLPAIGHRAVDGPESASAELLRGWLESTGPETAAALAARLALPLDVVDIGLARLESEDQILRGRFTNQCSGVGAPLSAGAGARADGEIEWCNRRLLARIHRLTLGRLRRGIEPVTAADFMRFLFRWQHLAPGTQLHGVDGTLQVLKQLQGYEISAAAWELGVLRRRVARYDPELLDKLCLSGEVMWGRLSPHPAFEPSSQGMAQRSRDPTLGAYGAPPPEAGASPDRAAHRLKAALTRSRLRPSDSAWAAGAGGADGRTRNRRVRPTRVAPVALFLRDAAGWLLAASRGREDAAEPNGSALSHAAREVRVELGRRGASFMPELVRGTGRLPSEVEDGLWELVAAGLVTADGFDNLRALVDPKRRRGEGRFRSARPRHAAGRWAMLRPPVAIGVQGAMAAPNLESGAPDGDVAEAFARQVLLRWGIVFRDLLSRESIAPPWRDLLAALRRMEARGEIRGGRFVSGFVGEQFARPEAIELLRAVRRTEPAGESLRVAAADPLNLMGIVTPGPRVSALAGGTVDVLGPFQLEGPMHDSHVSHSAKDARWQTSSRQLGARER